jgi:hypothetical protein
MYPICTHSLTDSEILETSQWANTKNTNHLAFLNNTKNARKVTTDQKVGGSNPPGRTDVKKPAA